MIQIAALTKYYGRFKALDAISFSVSQGEILGFLGPNGAGKTTTMRILTGFLPASEGTCVVGGADIFQNPTATKQMIGYLPETVPLYHELTVYEHLRFIAQIQGIASGKRRSAIDDIIQRCGLKEHRSVLIGHLSKGYRQRVGLAQALIHDPSVIVLDEPTAGLDPIQIREVRELIKDLGHDRTIILSSHILPEISQICQRVLIISGGRILAEDTPANLTRDLLHRLTCDGLVRGEHGIISRILGTSSAVLDFKITAAASEGKWSIQVVFSQSDQRPVILRELVQAGIEVYEFSTRQVSLEEVFLKLTTSEIDPDCQDMEGTASRQAGDHAPAGIIRGDTLR